MLDVFDKDGSFISGQAARTDIRRLFPSSAQSLINIEMHPVLLSNPSPTPNKPMMTADGISAEN